MLRCNAPLKLSPPCCSHDASALIDLIHVLSTSVGVKPILLLGCTYSSFIDPAGTTSIHIKIMFERGKPKSNICREYACQVLLKSVQRFRMS